MLTKFCDKLPLPKRLRPTARAQDRAAYYLIEMRPAVVRLHRELPTTTLWGCNGHYPGPTIEARSDCPTLVTWLNQLPGPHPIRPRWRCQDADPADAAAPGRMASAEPIPIWTSIHLHGGQTPPDSDGMPVNAFFPRQSVTCTYPNRQRAATLWYHDNAFGQSRVNTYAGLFGAYLLRDDEEDKLALPAGDYEIPLILYDVDLAVAEDGSYTGELAYELGGENQDFYGRFNAVNGKIWPYLKVEARQYRLRIINASASRFYRLRLLDDTEVLSGLLSLIGTDGGFLDKPLAVPPTGLVMGPGERIDAIIDFRCCAGRSVVLQNDAPAPYPHGKQADAVDSGAVLQFQVGTGVATDEFVLPEQLVQRRRLDRQLVQRIRKIKLDGPLPDGTCGSADSPEFFNRIDIVPELDSIEIWDVENPYPDSSILHVHLARMQILDRRRNGTELNEALAIGELGWKDTVQLPPEMTTRLLLHFSGYTGLYVYRYWVKMQPECDTVRVLLVVPKGKSLNC